MRRAVAGWKPFLHRLRETDGCGWCCAGGGAPAGNGIPAAGLGTAARVQPAPSASASRFSAAPEI